MVVCKKCDHAVLTKHLAGCAVKNNETFFNDYERECDKFEPRAKGKPKIDIEVPEPRMNFKDKL